MPGRRGLSHEVCINHLNLIGVVQGVTISGSKMFNWSSRIPVDQYFTPALWVTVVVIT